MSRHKVYSNAPAQELFPTLGFGKEHGIFINDDQTLSFGFLCQPLYGGDDSLSGRINVLLNLEWPENSFLQFNLFTSPDIEAFLADIETHRFHCQDDLLLSGIRSRTQFYRESTKQPVDSQTGMKIRDIQLLVCGKIPLKNPKPTAKEYKLACDLRNSLGQGLASANFQPQTIDANIYIRCMQVILNWGDDAGWRDLIVPEWDEKSLIRNQILDYGKAITVEKDGIWLDKKRVSVMSVKRYPDAAYFGTARAYLTDIMHGARGIRHNCMINATIHFPSSEKMRSAIAQKRQWTANQAYGPMAKFVPILEKKKHGFDVMFDALDDGDRPISFYLGMTLFADSEEDMQGAISNCKTFWRDQGFQMMEDKFFCMPLFLNNLPMCPDPAVTTELFRFRTLATRHAVPMLPIFSSWQGTGTPTLNLVSRDGQPMNFCAFDSETNYSTLFVATSGAGKSFLVNELVWSYLSTGGQFWLFDIGRSYKNICQFLDGTFMEFGEDQDICLNIFEMVQNWEEDADMIASLVSVMASLKGNVSDLQMAELKRTLKNLWDTRGRRMSIDDIANEMMKNEINEVAYIGKQLFPFTTAGEYGKYFNGKNNVDLNNRFCVLEMEELNGRKHLQKVVLLTLMFQIQQNMYLGDRDRNKVCMIDEGWALIAGGDDTNTEVGQVLAGFARKARKYGGGLWIATQSLGDLYQTPVGKAIVENAANKMLLKQGASSIEELRNEKRLPFNDYEYDLLKTVHTKKGVYSEVFAITDRGHGIGRLIVEDFKKILYSTAPQDVDAITLRVDIAGMSTEDAVYDYLKELGKKEGSPQYSTKELAFRRQQKNADRRAERERKLDEREALQDESNGA